MARKDWPAATPNGHLLEGKVYCCRGCAEGPGCTCLEYRVAEDAAPTKDEIREDAASGDFVQSLQHEHRTVEPEDYGTPAITKGAPRDAGPD